MTCQLTAKITAAIEADEEFKAFRLILEQQGQQNPQLQAWLAGPIEGQAAISDWLESQKNESKI